MAQEFSLLQEHSETVDMTKTKAVGHADANNSRNRFVDIVPCKRNSSGDPSGYTHIRSCKSRLGSLAEALATAVAAQARQAGARQAECG